MSVGAQLNASLNAPKCLENCWNCTITMPAIIVRVIKHCRRDRFGRLILGPALNTAGGLSQVETSGNIHAWGLGPSWLLKATDFRHCWRTSQQRTSFSRCQLGFLFRNHHVMLYVSSRLLGLLGDEAITGSRFHSSHVITVAVVNLCRLEVKRNV